MSENSNGREMSENSNVWRQMSGVKCLKHQNGRQMSWCQMSPQSNVLVLNVFDIKSLEVKHPASNVWATRVLGVKQLESPETDFF